MGRRWWIASGVLIGVLALTSYVLTRAADSTAAGTSDLVNVAIYGPQTWAPGPAVVLGGLLVVAGLLVAVGAVAYVLGRRHASSRSSDPSPIDVEAEPGAEPNSTTAGGTTGRRSWALPAALSLALALVAGGLVLVVTDPSSGYTLTNGARGIAPLDNVAAIPAGDVITSIGVGGVVGVVPEVAGLPYDVAVLSLEQAGFTALDVRDRDGGPVPDGVTPDRIVDRALPEPGTTPPSGTLVVLYLR